MFMSKCSAIVVICYVVFGLPSKAMENPPFSIKLSAVSSVKAGSDVYVQVSMHNLRDKPVDCTVASSNAIDLRFKFLVKDTAGNILKRKTGKHPELEGAGSIKMCSLDAGESTAPEDNLISNMYDLSSPGQYTVVVSRAVDDVRPEQYVQSNLITITVVP